MKLLHISDLHIGKRIYGYDLEDDQRYILKEIIDIINDEKPDAVLIAGDIYDRAAEKLAVSPVAVSAGILAERAAAKKAKNYARADEIRKILSDEGVTLIDTPQGTKFTM